MQIVTKATGKMWSGEMINFGLLSVPGQNSWMNYDEYLNLFLG